GKTIFRRTWQNVTDAGVLRFEAPVEGAVQATSGRSARSGPRYLLARLRPDVPAGSTDAPFARHAVFLLDTSAADNPRRFHLCVRLMRPILEKDAAITPFNVLTCATGSAWLAPGGWLANTKPAREQALARLDGIALEGAADLSAALACLAKPPWPMSNRTPV